MKTWICYFAKERQTNVCDFNETGLYFFLMYNTSMMVYNNKN